jgi:hypothetical protein
MQVESPGHKSREAKLIKLADKTSNIRAISFTASDWSVERRLEYVVAQVRGVSPGQNRNSMMLQRTRKSQFIPNDLDCDPVSQRRLQSIVPDKRATSQLEQSMTSGTRRSKSVCL